MWHTYMIYICTESHISLPISHLSFLCIMCNPQTKINLKILLLLHYYYTSFVYRLSSQPKINTKLKVAIFTYPKHKIFKRWWFGQLGVIHRLVTFDR